MANDTTGTPPPKNPDGWAYSHPCWSDAQKELEALRADIAYRQKEKEQNVAAWETEKAELVTKCNRLEHALLETIEEARQETLDYRMALKMIARYDHSKWGTLAKNVVAKHKHPEEILRAAEIRKLKGK